MDKVFVYGTLKRAWHNHRILEQAHAVLLGEYVTVPTFRMADVGFPVVLHHERGHRVFGELFEIPDTHLEGTILRLDRLEAEGRMYRRMVQPVLALGTTEPEVPAWMYVGIPEAWNGGHRWVEPGPDRFLTWEGRRR